MDTGAAAGAGALGIAVPAPTAVDLLGGTQPNFLIGRAVCLSVWGSRCVCRGPCRGSGQGKILSFSRSRPGSPLGLRTRHKGRRSLSRACDPGRGGLTLDKDECSPLSRESLSLSRRVYPCQGSVEILPCPGKILPCQRKAFILVKEDRPPRQGRTPSWLWWDFLVTNPPGRDRILVGTRMRVSAPLGKGPDTP